MFGMFAKPDLTLRERAFLMLHLVHVHLMGYVTHATWPSEDHRATAIDTWLRRRGKKAGVLFRAKISTAADEMSRFLAATLEKEDVQELYDLLNAAEQFGGKAGADVAHRVASLVDECERALIAKGMAS